MILFDINCSLAKQNYLQCDCYIDDVNLCKDGIKFSFPTWVPGSYLIRDFSRFIIGLRVESDGKQIDVEQNDGTSWSIAPTNSPIKISYKVYLFDISPRSGYLNEERLFFDGCRVFLKVSGALETEHRLSICNWSDNYKVHTTMPKVSTDNLGFGLYKASDYWEFIEHPVAIGDFISFDFTVEGVPHSCIIMENRTDVDTKRLKEDVEKVCVGQLKFWQDMPIDRYIFFLGVAPNGYGGIEHTYSSSLLCDYKQLPNHNTKNTDEDYISLLGLFSHEYLHVWNVKRLRPEVFVKPNLKNPVYTEQLWIFEGITSYYDDLNLYRTGVINEESYLNLLAKNFKRLFMNPGRYEQSLAESSFDAWTKFYQPNENSMNSIVSYYLKGSIIALMLDLKIIKDSSGKYSLQDVMQKSWQEFYKDREGLPEGEFEILAERVTGLDLKEFFNSYIRGTEDLEYDKELYDFGIKLSLNVDEDKLAEAIGIVLEPVSIVIKNVINNSAAKICGLCPGDEVLAISGYRVTKENVNRLIQSIINKKSGKILISRSGKIYEKSLLVEETSKYLCEIKNIETNELQKYWLKVYR